jgi:hypothetical protein
MLYSDEHPAESPCGMAKEPSMKTEELYSHMSEGSADEVYETDTAQSLRSEESVDSLDYTEHPEISAVVPEQDTEVGVRGVDDIKYKAVDASDHSVEQLSHTIYIDSALMDEQNAVIDAEGAHMVEHETYGFGHRSADKLDCAEYAEIPWTEIDAGGINEVEYDANDFDEHSDQLQSTEEQEDQQSHDYLKNAEFAAVCMKSRHSVVCTHCRLTATYLVKRSFRYALILPLKVQPNIFFNSVTYFVFSRRICLNIRAEIGNCSSAVRN